MFKTPLKRTEIRTGTKTRTRRKKTTRTNKKENVFEGKRFWSYENNFFYFADFERNE